MIKIIIFIVLVVTVNIKIYASPLIGATYNTNGLLKSTGISSNPSDDKAKKIALNEALYFAISYLNGSIISSSESLEQHIESKGKNGYGESIYKQKIKQIIENSPPLSYDVKVARRYGTRFVVTILVDPNILKKSNSFKQELLLAKQGLRVFECNTPWDPSICSFAQRYGKEALLSNNFTINPNSPIKNYFKVFSTPDSSCISEHVGDVNYVTSCRGIYIKFVSGLIIGSTIGGGKKEKTIFCNSSGEPMIPKIGYPFFDSDSDKINCRQKAAKEIYNLYQSLFKKY